jgi:very-short-patch-repair endonuclease
LLNMNEQIHNRKELGSYRKELRNNLTPAEATLWIELKGKQLDGRKFRRQHSVGYYILDFYCPTEKLCVELDGAGHFTPEGIAYDKERTAYLNSLNIRVIRFKNGDVFERMEKVLSEIKSKFRPPLTPPEPRGEQSEV